MYAGSFKALRLLVKAVFHILEESQMFVCMFLLFNNKLHMHWVVVGTCLSYLLCGLHCNLINLPLM